MIKSLFSLLGYIVVSAPLVGLAMIFLAPFSDNYEAFTIAGAAVVFTSLSIIIVSIKVLRYIELQDRRRKFNNVYDFKDSK